MIVTSKQQSVSPKATPIGKKSGYYGSAYNVGKRLVGYAGYAKELDRYLPDKYISKYTYKPHKRTAGYLGQAFWKKKFRYATGRQFNQKRCNGQRGPYNHFGNNQFGKGSFQSC